VARLGDAGRAGRAGAHLHTAGVEQQQQRIAQPSHVLRAMGMSDREARSSLRFSLGWNSTDADVDALLQALPAVVDRARSAPRLGVS
jgi:cysteine sulfinate desulfinase/cysteine desulfurase-like protein